MTSGHAKFRACVDETATAKVILQLDSEPRRESVLTW
jgi:hypothetical protein